MMRGKHSSVMARLMNWSGASMRVFALSLLLAVLVLVIFSEYASAQSASDLLGGAADLLGGNQQSGAQPVEPGSFDLVVNNAKRNSVSWRLAEEPYTRKLFWSLALIELVITVGLMLLPGTEAGSLLALGMAFIIRKGFWAFIMETAGTTLPAITESLQQIGVKATGVTGGITPQAVIDALGLFTISHWKHVGSNPIIWFEVAIGYFLVIIPFGLCALFTWIAYLKMYFVIGGGHIMLAFGGNKWLEDYARRFLSFVIAAGVNLLVLELCKGLFFTYLMEWINYANNSKELLPFSTLMRLSVYATAMAITLISVPSYLAGMVSGTVSHFAEGAALAAAPKALAAAASVMASAGKMVAQAAQSLKAAAAAASQGGGGMVLAHAGGGGITVSGGGTPPPPGGFGQLPGLGGGGGGLLGGGGGGGLLGGGGGGGRLGGGGGFALPSPQGLGSGTGSSLPSFSSPHHLDGSESADEPAPLAPSSAPSRSRSAGDRSSGPAGASSVQPSARAASGASSAGRAASPGAASSEKASPSGPHGSAASKTNPAAGGPSAQRGDGGHGDGAAPRAMGEPPSPGGAVLGERKEGGGPPAESPLHAKTMGTGNAAKHPLNDSASGKSASAAKKPPTDRKT